MRLSIILRFAQNNRKIAPCSNLGTRGYPAVFGSITRTSFLFSFSRRVQRPLRCTRTPTAGKGNAYARFRTTACRLRSHRTLSASGRFSTSDSPPSIPLNLYSKGAAPREGLLLFSGSGYSIAVRFLFVNDLINKNQTECSAKTPNFSCLAPTPPATRGAGRSSAAARKGKPPCVSVGAQRQQLRFSGRSERRSDRRRSSRPGPGPCVFTSRLNSHMAILCAAVRKNARTRAVEIERT